MKCCPERRAPVRRGPTRPRVEPAGARPAAQHRRLPWVAHLAVMPDVHFGKGATVGSVIAMRGAVSPAAVGVDIGCGMGAVRTSLTARDLPETCAGCGSRSRPAIPVGFARARRRRSTSPDSAARPTRAARARGAVRGDPARGVQAPRQGRASSWARSAAATTSSSSASTTDAAGLADAALRVAQHRQGAGRAAHGEAPAAPAQPGACPTATWRCSSPGRRRWTPTAATCAGRRSTRAPTGAVMLAPLCRR